MLLVPRSTLRDRRSHGYCVERWVWAAKLLVVFSRDLYLVAGSTCGLPPPLFARSGMTTGRAPLGATCGLSLRSILSGTIRSGEISMGQLLAESSLVAYIRSIDHVCMQPRRTSRNLHAYRLSIATCAFRRKLTTCSLRNSTHCSPTKHHIHTSPQLRILVWVVLAALQPEQEAVLQTALPRSERDRHLQDRQQHHREHHVLGDVMDRRNRGNRFIQSWPA